MKTIQQIVNDKVQLMAEDGTIQTMLEKGVEKLVGEVISSQLREYGDIGKGLNEAIKNGLKLDVSQIPMESYNQQMLVAVRGRLTEMFKGAAAEKFMAQIDEILAPAPKEMAITALVEEVVKSWRTDEPWDASDLDEQATVELANAFDRKDGSYRLKMWKKRKEEGYSRSSDRHPDLDLFIYKGEISINHKHVYNPTCFSEHEALVFKLYAAGTILTGLEEFDPEDCDLTLIPKMD